MFCVVRNRTAKIKKNENAHVACEYTLTLVSQIWSSNFMAK